MPKPMRIPILTLLVGLAIALPVRAATVIDVGAADSPAIPETVGSGTQPVYITNTTDAAGEKSVAKMTVDTNAALHLGYGYQSVASGGVTTSVAGDMHVEGEVHVGKGLTPGASGRPAPPTSQAIKLNVAGDLNLSGGALDITATTNGADSGAAGAVAGDTSLSNNSRVELWGVGPASGQGTEGYASLSTASLGLGNSTFRLGNYSILTVGGTAAAGAAAPSYGIDIGQGGNLIVDTGYVPSADTHRAGVGTAQSIRVGSHGVLSAGSSGGVIAGTGTAGTGAAAADAAGLRLLVERYGTLDASSGNMLVTGMAGVDVNGVYLAGHDKNAGTVNSLHSSGTVTIGKTGSLALSRDLQRAMNRLDYHVVGNSTILSAGAITFESGDIPLLKSAMGHYTLALDSTTSGTTGLLSNLWVSGVRNGVTGLGDATDRSRFAGNLNDLWATGAFRPEMADTVYNAAAAEYAPDPEGAAGRLNRDVFEAFIAGPGAPIGDRGGVADAGVQEFYVGGSQWGPGNAAFNTATQLNMQFGQRINHVVRESYRVGGISSANALASYEPERGFGNRVWAGGFERREDADLDYGISGYKYRPKGFMLGYDKALGRFALGGAVAYGKGDYEDKAALSNSSTIASYSAGAYGAYMAGSGLFVDGHVAYSYFDNDLSDTRGGLARTADYSSDAWSLGARIGYEMKPVDRFTLVPSVGLSRVNVSSREHTEYYDGVGAFRVGKLERRATMVPIDLDFGYDLFCSGSSLFRLVGTFGYAYDFDNDAMAGDMEFFGLPGTVPVPVAERPAGRNRFNFGAGFLYSGSKIDLTGRYDYFRNDSQDAHQFKGALGVKF